VTAAERLRRDFEIGQLRPRVTANWSAAVNSGRRAGDGSEIANLTDMALAARMRFDHAMREVGPDLSGVLIDVCCFLKGLETVERERQWPARSAKLVLKIALASLARHYGLEEAASGRGESCAIRRWGAEIVRTEGSRQWLRFHRDEHTAASLLAQITPQAQIRDISVEEPAIDEIVRHIYRSAARADHVGQRSARDQFAPRSS